MEIIDENKNQESSNTQGSSSFDNKRNNGNIIGGLIILAAGCFFLAREFGIDIPRWLLSWPMLLVALGLYLGIKNNFQNIGWLFVTLTGLVFLTRNFLPFYSITPYIWPIALIILGIYIMVKPSFDTRSYNYSKSAGNQNQSTASNDDRLSLTAVLGSIRKTIVSKDFKGGEADSVFGSCEINLSQAGFTGVVYLELDVVFGSIRLIVPQDWEIKSELSAVLGNVSDKRISGKQVQNSSSNYLVLHGNAILGSIEIVNY